MRTITRQGKWIIIHVGRRAYIHLYGKAKSKGWETRWSGDGMICMSKKNNQGV